MPEARPGCAVGPRRLACRGHASGRTVLDRSAARGPGASHSDPVPRTPRAELPDSPPCWTRSSAGTASTCRSCCSLCGTRSKASNRNCSRIWRKKTACSFPPSSRSNRMRQRWDRRGLDRVADCRDGSGARGGRCRTRVHSAHDRRVRASGRACPTFRGLYTGSMQLEADMHVHVHLENNVLFPRAARLAVNEAAPEAS